MKQNMVPWGRRKILQTKSGMTKGGEYGMMFGIMQKDCLWRNNQKGAAQHQPGKWLKEHCP